MGWSRCGHWNSAGPTSSTAEAAAPAAVNIPEKGGLAVVPATLRSLLPATQGESRLPPAFDPFYRRENQE